MIVNSIKIKGVLAFFALLFFSTSCVEEYWPELESNVDQLLVIDGKITNFDGPYTIILSTTNTLNTDIINPVSKAIVNISDDKGNNELLIETGEGVYKTSLGGIKGIIGNAYKINIQLSNGKSYESDFEEMINPVGVEDVRVEESWQLANNDLEFDKEGYRFYVSSKIAPTSKSYFYWEIEETFEYHSDYKIYYYYDSNSHVTTEFNTYGFGRTKNIDTLYFCWKTKNLLERFSYSTEYLSSPKVIDLPLHFIPFTDVKLMHGYSILVKQYTISENAFVFLDKLNKQNNNEDALYTIQPFQIEGNLTNIQDPSEPVLGYFIVAAGSLGPRILTKAPPRIQYKHTKCVADTTARTIYSKISSATLRDLPLYYTVAYFEPPNESSDIIEAIAYVQQDCLDCQKKGGTAIKPEYWDWKIQEKK